MNAPISSAEATPILRAEQQAKVVSALEAVVPAHALLWQTEDTVPYECDGLTAYRERPLVVVLPETDLAGAQLLAERIRASVEALAPFADDAHAVTVSIGIGLSDTQHDLGRVLGAADEALYRAKAKGRNRVEGPLD